MSAHPDSCAEADLTTVCQCGCTGTQHGESRAASRLAAAARSGQARPRMSADGARVASVGNTAGGAARRHRPGAAVLEAPPSPARLRAMSNDELIHAFARSSLQENWDAAAALDAQMLDREEGFNALDPPTDVELHWDMGEGGEPTEQQRAVDALVARGYDYPEAFAEVYGGDAQQMVRQQRASTVDRRAGEDIDAALRRSYDSQVYEHWLQAEADTRGHLLNAAGNAAGLDPVELFSGPAARARKYASEELQRWWAANERQTFTQYRAAILGRERDRSAAEKTRLGGNAKDFG